MILMNSNLTVRSIVTLRLDDIRMTVAEAGGNNCYSVLLRRSKTDQDALGNGFTYERIRGRRYSYG